MKMWRLCATRATLYSHSEFKSMDLHSQTASGRGEGQDHRPKPGSTPEAGQGSILDPALQELEGLGEDSAFVSRVGIDEKVGMLAGMR